MDTNKKIPFYRSIGGRLILFSVSIIFFSMLTLSVLALFQMSRSVKNEAFEKLKAIHEEKHTQLLNLFERTGQDSEVIAATTDVRDAVYDLITYHIEMNISPTGPYDITGETENLTKGYSEIYREINKNLMKYNKVYGYYDVFIVCAKHGHVMYTNTKESDLGQNLSTGELKNSNIAELWKIVTTEKETYIVDLENYAPSGGEPALFIGSPIMDNGEMIAVAILQINSMKFNNILNNTAGMGETGEVYSVGDDLLRRSESRFAKEGESVILKEKVDTVASRVLMQESSGRQTSTFTNKDGEKILSVYSHATIDEQVHADFDWSMIAEIHQNEIMKPAYTLIELISIIAVVILIAASTGMILMSRSISKPIQVAVDAAQEISQGNLTISIEKKYQDKKDEIGQLAGALTFMIDKLNDIIGVVKTGSEQIATSNGQLASGNQDLASRTEQQASALEETSAAIEEMNASIRSNAENTQAADSLSREALEKTNDGSLSVNEMINSMEDISVSSGKIADIIEVINNIAFQTNLLALNASIEAARAGEHGKGFAVVAVEVRKLAKRSNSAAAEIGSIIKQSNDKVVGGVNIANKAGAMLKEIENSVKKVANIVGEISSASQEQLSSVDQIDKTLSNLDENTQKNSALVEEAASATEELFAQTQELSSNCAFFKTSEEELNKETPLLEEPES